MKEISTMVSLWFSRNCLQKVFKKSIQGESIYKVPNDIEAIQIEIMTNGPVQALLRIYEDLLTHKSGYCA